MKKIETIKESLKEAFPISYYDVDKICDVVSEATGYSSGNIDNKNANKILYNVRNSQGASDLNLSDKEKRVLKKLVKKYNIKVTTRAFEEGKKLTKFKYEK